MEEQQVPEAEPARSKQFNRRLKWPPSLSPNSWALVLSLIVLIFLIILVSTSKTTTVLVKPIPIVSAPATRRDVPIYLSALGTVTPTYTVSVKTQINGQLLDVLYKEGQKVHKGDLLAQIDPRPYEALLTQYEGDLKRDQALLANAKMDLQRYQKLWKQDSIAQQTLATQISLVKQYEGAIKVDEGLIQGTKVNLIYCRITSPIDGRIGLRLVDPGNIVHTADTTGIAVINTLNPITVVFSLPEDTVPQVMPEVYSNKVLAVQAYDRQGTELLATGTLLTVDNQIDTTTGSYKLKASFENKENTLFPNQFVNMKLLVQTLSNATLVPTTAIQHATTGDFVYLLNNDETVSVKHIVTGPTSGEDTVIKSGITPGQAVVTAGSDKLANGFKVVSVSEPMRIASIKASHSFSSLHSIA